MAMNSAKATKIKDGYYRLQENDEMKELNKLLGIDWKKGIVKLEELNNYGKHSYTTEKIGKKEVWSPQLMRLYTLILIFELINSRIYIFQKTEYML